jgi:hypothetical protein
MPSQCHLDGFSVLIPRSISPVLGVPSLDMFFDRSVYEPVLRQADRIAFNDEPDMNSTLLSTLDNTVDRTSVPVPVSAPAPYRPLSNAFGAFLDALFFSLEPTVDRAVSRRIGESGVMPCTHPYAAFDAPAYRRRGRLIPELDRSNL